MPFSRETKIEAMIACGRFCPLCLEWKGIKVECHHIVHESKDGDNTSANCIPLCLDCHADQTNYDVEHPKGTKYQPEELRAARDRLYRRVAKGEVYSAISPEHRDVDRIVFQKMRAVLPHVPYLEFLKDSSFAAWSYPTSVFSPIWDYEEIAKAPESEFLDAELENARQSLVTAIVQFGHVLATQTFPVAGVPDQNQIPEIWRLQFPERHANAVRQVQDAADQLIIAYTLMIRLGRRRLIVN
jgi:hypothetical protein